ncbi:DUF6907 domain-containing protein [Streptomyces sp. NPDC057235]|uniref:DUF6907 domain-containing protein n=1 Tax=Streptomyces sp. NPDC057235 TaxID=3346058 RepID=UPI00363B5EC7
MSVTVPETFKPSGGFVRPVVEEPVQAPAEDRTVTVPLHVGGFLTFECPAWCTASHSEDIERGIYNPSELSHDGAEVSVELADFSGETTQLLAASIRQYPFSSEENRPYMALLPHAGNGESMGYLTAAEVNETIDRIEAHLVVLRKMSAQLAEATAEHHRQVSGGRSGRWASLLSDDVKTMPVGYLLEVFGARVVEGDGVEGLATMEPEGEGFVITLDRVLTQLMRETRVRRLLLQQIGGQR